MPLLINSPLRTTDEQINGKAATSPLPIVANAPPTVHKEGEPLRQELNQLRAQIKRESDAYRHHMLSAGYEDIRPRPLSTAQKIKDMLVSVQMAGSGHRPGHIPNRSLQQAWKAKERLAGLNKRYIPLARAEALAQMGEQLMDAEDSLRGLSGDKAAAVNVHVNRLRERFEAAKFAFAIDIGETLAKDTAPLLPLFQAQSYLGLQQAGQGMLDAAEAASGIYNNSYVPADRLQANQAKMYHEDELRMAAVDQGTNIVDDLREKHAETTPADKDWLERFTSQARQVLSRIDAALSLPGAEGVELEEVRVLLGDMLGKASPLAPRGYAIVADDVYRDTTETYEAQGYTQEMQRLAAALGGWVLGNGVLLTQRVGNALEEHPVRALGALAAYAAVSTFYNNWFLPSSPDLEAGQVWGHASDRSPLLDAGVDIALDRTLPDHPDALIGQALEDALSASGGRSRRSPAEGGAMTVAMIQPVLSRQVEGANQTLGQMIRQAGNISDAVDDHVLAQATASGLQRFEVKQAAMQDEYAQLLTGNMDEVIQQVVGWIGEIHAPILDPSAVVDDFIQQRIKDYEARTGTTTHLQPQSRMRVVYTERLPDSPNLHTKAALEKVKSYSLKAIVTGAHQNDVRLMRGRFGQSYKVVRTEHPDLIGFISKSELADRLDADFSAYKAQPSIKQKTAAFYQSRVLSAGLAYLDSTPATHPGHTLMARFLNGDVQASQVKFHGEYVGGMFAVVDGQKAVLCSVDDSTGFYIGEKVNRYWKFGAEQKEAAPVYPTDAKFKDWLRIKLPYIEQLKAARNPLAYEVTKTQFSTNALIGMGRTGGQINIKPLSFVPHPSIKSLSEGLFDASMERIESDIDTLIFTDWERFGLEGLRILKEILSIYTYTSMLIAPGTGGLLAKVMAVAVPVSLGAANAGVSALQSTLTDDPTERDAAAREALISMVTTGVLAAVPAVTGTVGGVMRGVTRVNNLATKIGHYRFATYYIQSNTPRVVKEMLAKFLGTKGLGNAVLPKKLAIADKGADTFAAPPKPWPGASGTLPASNSAPGPTVAWRQLGESEKTNYLSRTLVGSTLGKKLAVSAGERAVSQSVANNLRRDVAGPISWKSERAEINLAKTSLEADAKRLDTVERFIKQLRKQPPVIETRAVSGPPERVATTWIATSSSVKVSEGHLLQVIAQFQQADLNKISVIDDIHRAITGTSAVQVRLSGEAGLMGSDIAHGAFANHLNTPGVPTGLSRAEWLFALTQSFQPFAKHNDPLARTLYALAQLQDTNNNGFNVLAKTAEPRLSPPATLVKKPPAGVPVAPQSAPVVDTRVEPFRQIEGHPSRDLPVEMHGFMDKFRANPKLDNAFMAPAGECAKTSEIVAEFLQTQGFDTIKFRAMLIWSSRNPEGVFNHFFPIGNFQGKTYGFDLTAPQFANKGMPSLTEPMILPEPALMQAYQSATSKALIKYKDFSNLRSAETAFSGFCAPGPKDFIEGGHILTYGWSKPPVAQPVVAPSLSPPGPVTAPSRDIARINAQDIANHRKKPPIPVSTPAPLPPAAGLKLPELQMLGPKTWGALADGPKIDYLVTRLLLSDDARMLMGATSKATVVQTIRDNLELDGLGVPRRRFAWGGLQSEVGHGLRRLALDRARLSATNAAMQSLLDKPPVVPRELKPGNPQAMAAKWIVGASRSNGLTQNEVREVLLRNKDVDLTDIHVVDQIHTQVYKPGPGEPYRGFRSSSDPVYMASEIGHAGFAKRLPDIAQSASEGKLPLADGLFAAAVRFHPYGDGNGRLARTLYALAQLQKNEVMFEALTPAGEDLLNPRI